MSTTAGPGDGFEVVVGSDGTLSVPADELARHGVPPGAHLRVVPEHDPPERKFMMGALEGTLPPEAVHDLIRGLDESKAERIAYFTEQREA
jgi:hypothetical protein